MAKRKPALKFMWTDQSRRMALLLDAMGYSDRMIAECLNCEKSTIAKRIGRKCDRRTLSAAELQDLFEAFEAQRNMEEVLKAESGTTQQARLRTSLRLRKSKGRGSDALGPVEERLSDEQIHREVEALVGHPIQLREET